MTIKFTGPVVFVGDLEQKKDFTWKNIRISIDEDTEYPQTIEVQFSKNKAGLLDVINEGDEVEIKAAIKGNEWNGKVFLSLTGLTINVISRNPKAEPRGHELPPPRPNAIEQYQAGKVASASIDAVPVEDDSSELPF